MVYSCIQQILNPVDRISCSYTAILWPFCDKVYKCDQTVTKYTISLNKYIRIESLRDRNFRQMWCLTWVQTLDFDSKMWDFCEKVTVLWQNVQIWLNRHRILNSLNKYIRIESLRDRNLCDLDADTILRIQDVWILWKSDRFLTRCTNLIKPSQNTQFCFINL